MLLETEYRRRLSDMYSAVKRKLVSTMVLSQLEFVFILLTKLGLSC